MPGPADGREPDTEEATEAIIEGDVGFRRGTAQAALRNRDFRIFWGGTFASNIGTWMQNVLLGAFGYELTGSTLFVGVLFFAQLGPLLFMSTGGGALADVVARYRQYAPGEVEETGLARLLSGFRLAARDPLIRRILTTLVLFSFFSLTFVGLMPAIAADNFGIRPRSIEYGLLYAVFGFGAAMGAISVGTLLAGRSKAPIPRLGLVVFAGLLTAFALLRTDAPADPVGFVLVFCDFLVITSLATVLPENLDDVIRGRITTLW